MRRRRPSGRLGMLGQIQGGRAHHRWQVISRDMALNKYHQSGCGRCIHNGSLSPLIVMT